MAPGTQLLLLGNQKILAFFIQITCWAPRVSQITSTGLPLIFLRALCFFKRQDWKCSRHKIHFLPHLLVHIPNQFLALFLLMVLDQGWLVVLASLLTKQISYQINIPGIFILLWPITEKVRTCTQDSDKTINLCNKLHLTLTTPSVSAWIPRLTTWCRRAIGGQALMILTTLAKLEAIASNPSYLSWLKSQFKINEVNTNIFNPS